MPHLIREHQCAALRPLRLPTFANVPPVFFRSPLAAASRVVLESKPRGNTDLEEAALMEARRELGLLNQRLPALSLLAGLAPRLGLLGTVIGMIKDFQQVAESPDGPVMVHADEQRAFRYIVKLVEAVKCAGAVQLAIATEPGS